MACKNWAYVGKSAKRNAIIKMFKRLIPTTVN